MGTLDRDADVISRRSPWNEDDATVVTSNPVSPRRKPVDLELDRGSLDGAHGSMLKLRTRPPS